MDEKRLQKINKIITENGNSLHYRIVKFLRSKKWKVEVSPYYNDSFSEKPREIDIIAENTFPVYMMGGFKGTINVRLFIECKYITQDTVFWFDEKDNTSAINLILATTPLEDPRNWTQTRNHRYMAEEKVAKLFASEQNKSQSPEGEVIYKAVTQSLNALISYRNQPSILSDNHNGIRTDMSVGAMINYPIIVCDSFDKLCSYDVTSEQEPKSIEDNFQMEIRYAYRDNQQHNRNEYFLIDIASEDTLEKLLSDIEEKDIKAIKEKVAW